MTSMKMLKYPLSFSSKIRGEKMPEEGVIEEITNQTCPFCHKNTLSLRQTSKKIDYFGLVYIYSMSCSNCYYHKSDVELAESKGAVKCSFKVEKLEDLNARVVKASTATVRIGRIGKIEPGIASNGYITNVEGLLRRMKHQLEVIRDSDIDEENVAKAKSHLKKINRVLSGFEPIEIVLDDPEGNSAIISDKAECKINKKKDSSKDND
ncbi:MAG: zinc finger protein [Candidatus Woesearchaeota archaeon]|nr:zinc finger protein [Candidatus Woesearchaeota archaeon]